MADFDPTAYAALQDEDRAKLLSGLGLGTLPTDDFLNSKDDEAQIAAIQAALKPAGSSQDNFTIPTTPYGGGNYDPSQALMLGQIFSKAPTFGASLGSAATSPKPTVTPSMPTVGPTGLPSGPMTQANAATAFNNFLNKYLDSINAYQGKQTASNKQIADQIAKFQDQSKQYQDPLSIPNIVQGGQRLQQALAQSQGLIHTSAGSIANHTVPDTTGIANSIGQMVQDGQNFQNKSYGIDSQNFNNWLQQKVREQAGDAQTLGNQEKLAQLGITGADRLASIQAMSEYRNAIAAARNAPDTTPSSTDAQDIQNGLARRQFANVIGTNQGLLDQSSNLTKMTDALVNSKGDWKAAVSTLAPQWSKAYESIMGSDPTKTSVTQLQQSLKGMLGTIGNLPGLNTQQLAADIDSGDPSRMNGAAKLVQQAIQNGSSWYNQMTEDSKGGLTGDALAKRMAQYKFAAPLTAPTVNNGFAKNFLPSSVVDKLNERQNQAINQVKGLLNKFGVKESYEDFYKKFNDAVSNGYTGTIDQFVQDYSKPTAKTYEGLQ